MTELARTYICPQCGYDGFKLSGISTSVKDVNVQPQCPACWNARGLTVSLVETSDPRDTP